jgi:vanillate/4-hydroxybenzoate decarboxylase subunit C
MRAYQDLREFLSALEREQHLIRITEQVKFEPELAAAGCALARMGESSPAILFNNIAGCTDAQVAMNVHGSWPNHALALGMDKDASRRDQFFEFVRRFKQFPGEMERATTAPWQEITVENNINLFELMPLFRLNRGTGVSISTRPALFRATPTTGTMTTSRTSESTG